MEISFKLNLPERVRLSILALGWLLPIALYVVLVANLMDYRMENYQVILQPASLIFFSWLCIPCLWLFSPEHLKSWLSFFRPSSALKITEEGIEWNLNHFCGRAFYWKEVEMIALQYKGWSRYPYLVVYTREDWFPLLTWPVCRREILRTKDIFGHKAAVSISLDKLGIREVFFKKTLEKAMMGNGFLILKSNQDTFYKKVDPLVAQQQPKPVTVHTRRTAIN